MLGVSYDPSRDDWLGRERLAGPQQAKDPVAAVAVSETQQRKKRHQGKTDGVRQQQRLAGRQAPAAAAAVCAVGLYTCIRGGISLFHTVRRAYLRQLLLDLSDALNTLGLTHWLDFGGLLGIYRDGDLITHDNDIDLAVLQVEDWQQLLAQLAGLLPRYGMRIVVPSEDPDSRFIRVYCPFGMADVFGASVVGEDRLLVDCGHGSCTEIGRRAVLPTGMLEWRGHKLSVPGNVPAALEERYGKSWRVPRYMDKGADVVEGQKLYARIFRALATLGIRI